MHKILLTATSDYLPLYVARALAPAGHEVYCVGPAKLAVKFSRYCKKFFVSDSQNIASGTPAFAKKINDISQQYGIECVIPTDIPSVFGMTQMNELLTVAHFPMSDEKTIQLFNNKWDTAQFMRTHNLPHPKTEYILNESELAQTSFTMPFFIKPTSLESGQGIVKISTQQDLAKYIQTPSPFKIFPLIIQDAIPGKDIDISIMAKNGELLCWTIQQWIEAGVLEFIEDKEAVDIARKIARAANYTGLIHIDMRRDTRTKKLTVFEGNPRVWGSMNASIYAGVDFIDLGIRIAHKKKLTQMSYQPLRYETSLHAIRNFIKNPFSIFTASETSKMDLHRVFSDPLPYIILTGIELTKNLRIFLIQHNQVIKSHNE